MGGSASVIRWRRHANKRGRIRSTTHNMLIKEKLGNMVAGAVLPSLRVVWEV